MSDADSYIVKLSTGDTRVMSVDELDAALEAGTIHAGTPLLAPGSTTWTTLGVLAGLDDVAPAAPPPPFATPFVPATPPSLAPMAFGAQTDLAAADVDALGISGRRRAVKAVGIVFGVLAAVAVVFGIQSAVSQSIASSAAQAALAAQPPPPAPSPIPPPAPRPPVAAPAPPAAAAAPAPAPASASAPSKAKDADKKKGKLPGAPKKKK